MDIILNGLKNFLETVNDNWTTILVIIGLIIAIIKKIKNYVTKSDEEKIAIAKEQITQSILNLISEAEKDYSEWNKAGSIKRSQVIDAIYTKYPILSKVTDQESLINFIDEAIDNSLTTLRVLVQQNQAAE